MNNDKLSTITNLFEGVKIRSIWNKEDNEYYFSVVDVISALTGSNIPKRYWADIKRKLLEEGSQLYEKIVRLKLTAQDGKNRETDTLNTEGILRLIESVPSPKAEPFKLWLASLGKERIDEVFDPEIAINRAVNYYRAKGFDDNWIELRLKGILNRKKLTDVWNNLGIKKDYEYGILTNEIYKESSDMNANEYKEFKHLKKENLRDNMTDLEVILTDLGEVATREIALKHKPYGLEENKSVARLGGHAAKVAKDDIEKNLFAPIVVKKNTLLYKYLRENTLKEEK